MMRLVMLLLTATAPRVATVGVQEACAALEPALFVNQTQYHHGPVLAALEACVAAIEPGPAAADAVALATTRFGQLQVYAWARGAEEPSPRFRAVAARLADLASRADPKGPYSPAERGLLDRSDARYGPTRRSGRDAAAPPWKHPRGPKPRHEPPVRAGDPRGSLLVHKHLTFHGGTFFLNTVVGRQTRILTPPTVAAQAHLLPGLRHPLSVRADPEFRGPGPRRPTAADANGSLVDAIFYEPTLWRSGHPQTPRRKAKGGAVFRPEYLATDDYVLSVTARHPATFALSRGITAGYGPEFMLEQWHPGARGTRECDGRPSACPNPTYCEIGLSRENLATVAARTAAGELTLSRGSRIASCLASPEKKRGFPSRRALEKAKAVARRMNVPMILEHFGDSLRIYCTKLKWPDCDARGLGARHRDKLPNARKGGRRLNVPHHGVEAALEAYGFDRHAFANLVDASQKSTELYYYVRELNRAMHLDLGLPPPSTRAFPERAHLPIL